ncbi:MAG TPA: hypothetical protein VHM19_09935 [Polyangiales bacterium]|nr:hypothetical protein [Polyangiales bacterium]
MVFGGIYYWVTWGYRAAFALVAMLPISIFLFSKHHKNPTRAACLVLLGAMMWLPEQARFDFPVLPALDKYTISALCALLGAFTHARKRVLEAKLGRHPIDIAMAVMLAVIGIGTFYTNQDPLTYGAWIIVHMPGLKPYDAASIGLTQFMIVGLPFLLGRIFLRTAADVLTYFKALATAGIVYSIPILWEIRMSPQLHNRIYGFYARLDWAQNIRAGGYRPTVFMGHGLVVGFFVMLTLIAMLSLRKSGRRGIWGMSTGMWSLYLFGILVLCKAGAAIILGVFAAVTMLWLSVKNQMRITMFLSFIVFIYPALRIGDYFPTDTLVRLAAKYTSEDRAGSLQFRFDNEDVLLLKGAERPWFGWGGFGRERMYDPITGKDLTVQDGQWVIVYGQLGICGFLLFYGVMLTPGILLAFRMNRIPKHSDRALLAGFAFITSLCAVNSLPNMYLPVLPFFLSGGLVALAIELPKHSAAAERKERAARESSEREAPVAAQ